MSEPEDFTITPPTPPKSNAFDSTDAVFERAHQLKKVIDTAYIGLGRELYQIFHRRLFVEKGFNTFDDWCENGLGISIVRGYRVRRIWTKFVKELNLRTEQLEGVGYTRAFEMLGVINESNAQDWLTKARTLSQRDFLVQIAVAKNPTPEALQSLTDAGVPTEKREVQEDNDDLSGEGGFDDIPGGGGGALPSERSGLSASGHSPDRRRPPRDDHEPRSAEVLPPEMVTLYYKVTKEQATFFKQAVDEVRRADPREMSDGRCLNYIALEFLNARLTKEQKASSRVEFYLAMYEKVFGGKFVWIKSKEAADVLTRAIEEHPSLFNGAAVPTTTTEKEEDDHEHPDDESQGSDDDADQPGAHGSPRDGHGDGAEEDQEAAQAG